MYKNMIARFYPPSMSFYLYFCELGSLTLYNLDIIGIESNIVLKGLLDYFLGKIKA